jgi:catechol 2,3-dioxygenase-like lactoylglutathione lyase family enzyme
MKRFFQVGVCLALLRFLILSAEARGDGRPAIIGLSHVCFQSEDLGKTRTFFHELLGYDEPFKLAKDVSGFETACFKINDRQYVEIHAGLKAGQEDVVAHLAFETTDAEGMRRFLAGKGIAVPDKASKDALGNLCFTVHDPEGRLVEFTQYLPDSLLMTSKGQSLPARRLSERIFHAGMPVINPEEACRFYRDILGFTELLRSHQDRAPTWINMKIPEAGAYIEWNLMDKASDPRKISMRYHFALSVPDMQATAEVLRERAENLGQHLEGFPNVGLNNRWQLGVLDPEGRRHELMEPYTMR